MPFAVFLQCISFYFTCVVALVKIFGIVFFLFFFCVCPAICIFCAIGGGERGNDDASVGKNSQRDVGDM